MCKVSQGGAKLIKHNAHLDPCEGGPALAVEQQESLFRAAA